jgi:hypothetical protein
VERRGNYATSRDPQRLDLSAYDMSTRCKDTVRSFHGGILWETPTAGCFDPLERRRSSFILRVDPLRSGSWTAVCEGEAINR